MSRSTVLLWVLAGWLAILLLGLWVVLAGYAPGL
jgi:hypothetical protein